MEAATKERELSGEKGQRIIDAMRESVAKRGAAGSTFEHVAREAGGSRGVPHDEPLGERRTTDDVTAVLLASLTDLTDHEPAFFLLLYELFSAGRRNPD